MSFYLRASGEWKKSGVMIVELGWRIDQEESEGAGELTGAPAQDR